MALPIGSWIAATSGARPSLTQALVSGITAYAAKVPGTWTPRIRKCWQTWARPVRHWVQVQSTMWLSAATSSPRGMRVAPGPAATTMPAISWPKTIGVGPKLAWAQSSQRSIWMSVPQTLAASTRTRISPGPGSGTGTSRNSRPGARAGFTRARIVGGRDGSDIAGDRLRDVVGALGRRPAGGLRGE